MSWKGSNLVKTSMILGVNIEIRLTLVTATWNVYSVISDEVLLE